MTLRISGKNLDIGPSLRSQVEARVAGALAKYFDGGYSGHVTVARDGTQFRTECVLHLTSGVTLEASGAAHDAYASFDQTAERLETRLRRYKKKLKSHASGVAESVPAGARAAEPLVNGSAARPAAAVVPDEAEDPAHPVVVAENPSALPCLSTRDAVHVLDRREEDFCVFLHAGTGRVNVVYRRRDGAIGWVDPPAPRAS